MAASAEELSAYYAGGSTVGRILKIEKMARVPARVEICYVAALMTLVLFRDRSCLTVQPCQKISPEASR
jgi:hypothetical protein